MITFGAVEPSHLTQFKHWRNRWYKYFRQDRPLADSDQVTWFTGQAKKDIMFAVYDDGELIGCAGLVRIDWVARHAELSCYIGDSFCDEGTQDIIKELCRQAFDVYNLFKVYFYLYDFDPRREIVEDHTDFNFDAKIPDDYYCDGRLMPSYIYSMTLDMWHEETIQ